MDTISGIVFNIARYAVHDGPGIRTTVYLKGCPLSCWWCHNPEGIRSDPEIVFWPDRCIDCADCDRECSFDALRRKPSFSVDAARCNMCGACVEVCNSRALEIAGNRMTVDEVFNIIDKDRPFYEQSNGGVTFSGGEPTSQPRFLSALINMCRSRGIHTAIDTTGYAETETLLDLAEKADLILFDVKLMDSKKHKKYTGVDNELILKNLQALSQNGTDMIIRFPLIPTVNDDDRNISEIGEFVANATSIKTINLLPYHAMAKEKFKRMGLKYKLNEISSLEEEQINHVVGIFRKFNLRATVGG